MEKIIELINLLEISRIQPQYGYNLAGGNTRVGNLAEHHYLVTMIAWQLCDHLNEKGAKIDTLKTIKFSLLHDIGELFGGDIGMYYAKAYAKQFEEENQKFLAKFFNNTEETEKLTKEILESESDESHIVKIADYIEVTHYKLFNGQFLKKDVELIVPKLKEKIEKIENKIAKEELSKFIDTWVPKISKYESFLEASTDALKI